MFSKKKKRLEISAPSNFEHRVHTGYDQREQKFTGLPRQWQGIIEESAKRPKPLVDPVCITAIQRGNQKTIVRGNKAPKDGALTLLLEDFENMSVTRSNSLRRDSPPCPPRRDPPAQENGLAGVRPPAPRASSQQPRGQEPAPPEHPKPPPEGRTGAPERGGRRDPPQGEGAGRPARREGPEKRPKSSYAGGAGGPQPPRDKRPLSGPSLGTPHLPAADGAAETARQGGRPFNTYPRADTDPGRGSAPQVTPTSLPRPPAQPPERPGGASRPLGLPPPPGSCVSAHPDRWLRPPPPLLSSLSTFHPVRPPARPSVRPTVCLSAARGASAPGAPACPAGWAGRWDGDPLFLPSPRSSSSFPSSIQSLPLPCPVPSLQVREAGARLLPAPRGSPRPPAAHPLTRAPLFPSHRGSPGRAGPTKQPPTAPPAARPPPGGRPAPGRPPSRPARARPRTPRTPSWPAGSRRGPSPRRPRPPGRSSRARRSGSPSACHTSSSARRCRWWWTPATPAPTWTTSSRSARAPPASSASPPSGAAASSWPSKRWT
uniref:non-specific serine/threonine protein kinase n=1 Tax=Ornithorhynchus anatinus TaxID=9258 RepID=A0A6I8NTM0_ORNAN